MTKGTQVIINLSEKGTEQKWEAKLSSQDDNTLTIRVTPPPKCFIGKWKMEIRSISKKPETIQRRYRHKSTIYILFNPWNKGKGTFI